MSDDSNITVEGAFDAGWSSYWDNEQSQVVGPDRDVADANGTVTSTMGESEDDGGNLVWPPDSATKTEIRRQLLNGESTQSLADELPVSKATIYKVGVGDRNPDLEADIPPLKFDPSAKEWVVPETTDDEGSSDDWPPSPAEIDNIRHRLVDGETAPEIAQDYPRSESAISDIAKEKTFKQHPNVEAASTSPVHCPGGRGNSDWEFVERDNSDVSDARETDVRATNGDGELGRSQAGVVATQSTKEGERTQLKRRHSEDSRVLRRWSVVGVLALVIGWLISRAYRNNGGDER